jgi:hypothetical protein
MQMSKKIAIPNKYKDWVDARSRFHLSNAQIQMARELGMNPKKFGKLANHKQERWKLPLPQYIEELYFKRFGKERPDEVKSIERLVKDQNREKEERRKRVEVVKNPDPEDFDKFVDSDDLPF